jgi:hypothetical protein
MRNLFSYGFVRPQCGPVGGEIKITLWAITVVKNARIRVQEITGGAVVMVDRPRVGRRPANRT